MNPTNSNHFRRRIISIHTFERISVCNKITYFIIRRVRFSEFEHKKVRCGNYDSIFGIWYKGSERLWTAVAAARRFVFFLSPFFRDSRKRSAAHVFRLFIFMELKGETGLKKEEKIYTRWTRNGGKRAKNIKCVCIDFFEHKNSTETAIYNHTCLFKKY